MTWGVRFGGKDDKAYGYSDIKKMVQNRKHKLQLGQTYAKGDDVFMSLFNFMEMLTRPIEDITKVEALKKLNELKGFSCHPESTCKGYEIFWIDEASETKEYDWLGLVVIVEEYEGEWFVAGLLRDRWTI